MPAATPLPLRQKIAEFHAAGVPPAAIAWAVAVPARTVRHLLAAWRLAPGAGLAPAWPRCGRTRSADRQPVHRACLQLRRDHPGWGAGRLRVALQASFPAVPGRRAPQRWLAQAGLGPPPSRTTSGRWAPSRASCSRAARTPAGCG